MPLDYIGFATLQKCETEEIVFFPFFKRVAQFHT